MRAEYTELAFLQQLAGNTAMYAFLLAVMLVFLVLAAQYESWALPLAVILVVPMCLLCSIVGVITAGMDINIFTQIGFVVLVGLACKNAILIVEYARSRNQEGISVYEATLDACRLRLRPIIMTSFAFIFGVVPLVLGEGAGAEMRRTLGTAVFAGMLGVTLFGILLTPVFFYVIQRLANWRRRGNRQRSLYSQGGRCHTSPRTETEVGISLVNRIRTYTDGIRCVENVSEPAITVPTTTLREIALSQWPFFHAEPHTLTTITKHTVSGGRATARSGIARSPSAHSSANRCQDCIVLTMHCPDRSNAVGPKRPQQNVAGISPQRNLRVGSTLL